MAYKISVYPNPAVSNIYINCKNGYLIFDLNGSLIKEKKFKATSVYIGELLRGMCIIKTGGLSLSRTEIDSGFMAFTIIHGMAKMETAIAAAF